jgi:hypothetical protein
MNTVYPPSDNPLLLCISAALRVTIIPCLLVCSAFSAEESGRIDFRNDLIPVFTKHGCNAGACHGAAIGRGGFKLSLYGGNPDSDFEAVARQVNGRRINLSRPDSSLIFLKPAEYVEHGGGTVFADDSESAQLLIDWIKQGAANESPRDLTSVEITPKKHIAKSLGEPVVFRAVAHYSDGTSRDVTRWTIFKAEDDSAVEIADSPLTLTLSPAGERGQDTDSLAPEGERAGVRGQQVATVLRRGRHIVVARYLNKVVPIEMVVPLTNSRINLADESKNNFIDEEILQSLAVLGLPPAPIVDDTTFLRRISLDLTGRLPSAKQVNSFLASGPLSPGADLPRSVNVLSGERVRGPQQRTEIDSPSPPNSIHSANAKFSRGRGGKKTRAALVDELLSSDEFTEYWTLQLAKLLRIRPQPDDSKGALAYHAWLSDQVRDDVSYKQLARRLIMASGDSHENGPANFYRTVAGPREQAEFMSELFMGSRLRCANCHNHPLDRWTQDDYHGLAAIFAKIERGEIVSEKPDGQTIHPRTLEPAIPKIPGPSPQPSPASGRGGNEVGREQLADWLTDSSNPWFAKAIVNRLWKRMMGRGLVEPVDDFRDTNPSTHPALLDKLARDFIANDYSLRHTLRVIASSATYARSANATALNKDDNVFYSHAARRPLEPEVLADAISDSLGVAGQYGDEPDGTRAVMLVNPKTPSRTLDILGRCGRDESCESSPGAVGGLPQKLHLFNGALLNARIAAKGSRLNRLHSSGIQPMEIVNEFYLEALSRRPSEQEQEHWKGKLARLKSTDKQRVFLEDFVWGLMTCNEFITNH